MSNGTLYIVATPIGNLDDITARAIQVLQSVDLIAAEDTRHSRKLLGHFGIGTPMLAYHDHNENDQTGKLIDKLKAGQSIALISDAGTPLISDPGYQLVHAAHAADISVVPVPGACAAMAALSASGLPVASFTFIGFLPAKSTARRVKLEAYVTASETLIFYESTHRIVDAMADMVAVLGEARPATLARELTKKFETIRQSTLGELHNCLIADENQQRGEFVIMVAGRARKEVSAGEAEIERILKILLTELPAKQAAKLTANITGASKNKLYDLSLQLKSK